MHTYRRHTFHTDRGNLDDTLSPNTNVPIGTKHVTILNCYSDLSDLIGYGKRVKNRKPMLRLNEWPGWKPDFRSSNGQGPLVCPV